ncbi:MAG: leucyl aminopeptidase family protein [Bacteriovoracaceae bacterium]
MIEFSYSTNGEVQNDVEWVLSGVWSGKNLPINKKFNEPFSKLNAAKNFTGEKGDLFSFSLNTHTLVGLLGLGDKTKLKPEDLRRVAAKVFKGILAKKFKKIAVDFHSFEIAKDPVVTAKILGEAFILSAYVFDKYKSEKKKVVLPEICFIVKGKNVQKKIEETLAKVQIVTEGVAFARTIINEPPNILNSLTLASTVEKDIKTVTKGSSTVKIKILNKQQIQKERMNLLLSVNKGSAFEPRVVHLTYTPKKKPTKHVVLVGKGLTFDSGGYSLKSGTGMMNMKFDMAGAATMYAAFRNAVLLKSPYKITCLLGITDNMISSRATTPDSIITGRNGKTVEILNTDAEGRLVLGDVLDYGCEQEPDEIIDAATLTGACVAALGAEVCGVMGNNQKLIDRIKASAQAESEYIWQLPLIDEHRNDIKSTVADIKNIGSGNAGAQKGAVFLEEFIKKDKGIAWAHLDIAGVGDSQSHLPYCPEKGASGVMIRTVTNYLTH